MTTPERCLDRAREAERLAATVSYERDRERLLRQAADWRAQAAAKAAPSAAADAGGPPPRDAPKAPAAGWLRGLLGRGGR